MQIYTNQTHNATYMLTHTLGTLSHIPSSCRNAIATVSCQYPSKMMSSEQKRSRLESYRCAEPVQKTKVFPASVIILSLPSEHCTSDQSSPSSSLPSSLAQFLPLHFHTSSDMSSCGTSLVARSDRRRKFRFFHRCRRQHSCRRDIPSIAETCR